MELPSVVSSVVKDSTWSIPHILAISLFMVGLVGVGPGFPGIRQVVLDEGVFNSECPTSDECDAQENRLAAVVNVAYIIMNSSLLFLGIIKDKLANNRLFGTVSCVLWTIFFAIMGVSPKNGIIFSVCFIITNMTAVAVFFVFLLDLTSGISPQKYEVTLRSIYTGFSDLGSITFVLLSQFYYFASPTLWQLFLGYGIIIGVLCTLYLFLFTPPPKVPVEFHSTQNLKPQLPWTQILRIPFLWISITNTFTPIAYGYLWLSLVVNHMEWKGASEDEAKAYNQVFAWMLPFLGTTAALTVGFTINFRQPRTLRNAYLVQGILAFCVGVFALVPGPLWLQYITFVFVILCRMYGCCVVNASLPAIFPYGPIIGRLLGLAATFSGIMGLLVDQASVYAVTHDPNWFFTVHLLFCAFGVIVALFGAWRVGKDLNEKCQSLELLELIGPSAYRQLPEPLPSSPQLNTIEHN